MHSIDQAQSPNELRRYTSEHHAQWCDHAVNNSTCQPDLRSERLQVRIVERLNCQTDRTVVAYGMPRNPVSVQSRRQAIGGLDFPCRFYTLLTQGHGIKAPINRGVPGIAVNVLQQFYSALFQSGPPFSVRHGIELNDHTLSLAP